MQPTAYFLLSVYKPLLALAAVLPFAWAISSVVEQDARRRRFLADVWGAVNVLVLLLGIVVVVFVPWFWLGWPLMVALYAGALTAYWKYRDGRLPPDEHFQLAAGRFAAAVAARKARKAFGEVTAVFQDAKGNKLQPPAKTDAQLPVHLGAEQVVVASLPARATRVDLIAGPEGHVHWRTIDTVRTRVETIPTPEATKVIDYLKKAAALDTKERRKRQVATLGMRAGDNVQNFRMTTWGSSAGQHLRLEHDRERQLTHELPKMGFLAQQLESLKEATDTSERPGGVVVVAMPTAGGLTSLALALLHEHDPYTFDIKTVEKLVERKLEGVTHQEWSLADGGADYAATVQTVVRRGPAVMLVSDLMEPGVGPILISRHSTSTLFYCLVPAESGPVAIQAFLKATGDSAAASKVFRAVIDGRTIRTLCSQCRQQFEATPEQAKRVHAPAGKPATLYKAGGQIQVKNHIVPCPACQGTGFVGATGAYEVLWPDERAVELLAAGDVVNAFQQMRRAHRSPLAQEVALSKVRSGETSLEEVARAFASRTPAKPKTAAAARPTTHSAPPTPPAKGAKQ